MTPPRFLVGKLPGGESLWAAIDPLVHHVDAAVAERRFAAYCAPFRDDDSAHAALKAAGADHIEAEAGRRPRGR